MFRVKSNEKGERLMIINKYIFYKKKKITSFN